MISSKMFYCYYFTLFTEPFKCVNKTESIMVVIVWTVECGVSAGISISIHVWLPARLACPVQTPR